MTTRTAVLTVPLSLLACTTPADRVPASANTVVNAAPDAATPRWRLSAEPHLAIGREGDPLYEFFRPQQALSLSDGRIVVSNAFHEVRYYHPDGTYQMTAGREGRGPGEFTHLMSIHVLPGDSVAAKENRDGAYEEMVVFDPHGRMARAFRFELSGEQRLADGAWIGMPREGGHGRRSCAATPTAERIDQALARATPNGKASRGLTRILAGHVVRMGCTPHNVPLGPQGAFVVGGTLLFTTENDSHVVHVRSIENGEVLRTIVTAAPRHRVTPGMIDDALNPPRPPGPPLLREPGVAKRRLPEMTYPEFLPAIASMRVDAAGNLWVRRFYLWTDPQHEWWIYDATGHLVAMLMSPARFRFTEIGDEYILGIWRDEDDVETVKRFGLLKEPR